VKNAKGKLTSSLCNLVWLSKDSILKDDIREI